MKKPVTRFEQLQNELNSAQHRIWNLGEEKDKKEKELETFVKRHKSYKYDGLATTDTGKLNKIYKYFDDKYPIEWQGGLRCDDRGMALHYWLDDDPDYLILHLSSNHDNICFSGSTSWLVKAVSLEDKITVIKQIKEDIKKILK